MNDGSTRSTLIGILVLAARPLTAPQIVALGRALRLSATNIKSHLTRLTAEGVLSRVGSRRSQLYSLSGDRERVVHRLRASLTEQPAEPWTGDWVMVAIRLPADRSRRERLRADLWFDGFRPCAAGTYLRPAWPVPWAIDRARAVAPTALCVVGKLAGTIRLDQVQKMYGLDALDRHARVLAARIDAHLPDIQHAAAAFRARLRVGGRVARLVGHDPRLPPSIWAGRNGVQELREAFQRFEARVGPVAERFVDGVITPSGAARVGRDTRVVRLRRPRSARETRRSASGLRGRRKPS